jgi:hypothetical protein
VARCGARSRAAEEHEHWASKGVAGAGQRNSERRARDPNGDEEVEHRGRAAEERGGRAEHEHERVVEEVVVAAWRDDERRVLDADGAGRRRARRRRGVNTSPATRTKQRELRRGVEGQDVVPERATPGRA